LLIENHIAMSANIKTVLITGGSRGIGLGIARRLATEGWDLAINGVREEAAVLPTLETLRAEGRQVIYCRGDVGQARDRHRILTEVQAAFGQLNALVSNAGVAPTRRLDLLEATEESFDRVLNINLKGAFFLARNAAPLLIDAKRRYPGQFAAMIFVSSISAAVASVNRGEYCISKAALSMVARLYAARLAEYDIPVYELRPGIIDTDMTAAARDKYDRLFQEGLAPQARWGAPDDVGRAVAALLRGDFPYSTGQVMMIDGGMGIQRL
jgi:3-oxoacyl-[acyl-carrier protein] reductase